LADKYLEKAKTMCGRCWNMKPVALIPVRVTITTGPDVLGIETMREIEARMCPRCAEKLWTSMKKRVPGSTVEEIAKSLRACSREG